MKRSFLIAMAMAWCLDGCTTAPQPTLDPLGAAPSDFYIDVTILENPGKPRPDAPAAPPPTDPALQPARYVLFADGTLRYGPDPDSSRGVTWLPPITRILTRAQTAHVWSLAQQLGLTDPNAADPLTNFKLIAPEPEERVVLVDFRGGGRRWNFIRPSRIDEGFDPAFTQFVQHLSQLAWAEASESEIMVAPRRYDFGPDPYARYRNREAEK